MGKKIIINIGRQFGSGGKSVATALGVKLGIPVYDNELLAHAAEEFGFGKHLFAEADEQKRSLMLGLGSIFTASHDQDVSLFKMQSEAIRSIAEKGSAIIIGRCADYVLRDMDCTLDVFLTAPDANRVKRVVDRTGKTAEESRKLMEKKDKERSSYYNYFTFGNWGVASNYDLCIDSSKLGIEGTADFIIDFARKAGLLDE